MEGYRTYRRWTAAICGYERSPQVGLDWATGLNIDPTRRGLSLYEHDWQRMVQLSAKEALELLAFLQDNTEALGRMAEQDEAALVEAARQQAERVWLETLLPDTTNES